MIKPSFQINYNGKNITDDITRYIVSLTYTDRVTGSSDDLELKIADSDDRWVNEWAPSKGDKISVTISDGTNSINCGTFEIDEIEYEGPPAGITIRALAAGMSKAVRSKVSSVHEKKTLLEVAKSIAEKNGFTFQGNVENITLDSRVQHRENDLAFLMRTAKEYGYAFSIRDSILSMYNVFELEAASPLLTLSYKDFERYSIRQKMQNTVSKTVVHTHNPQKNEYVKVEYAGVTNPNADGINFTQVVAGDTQLVKTKTDNAGQADRKAKAAHHAKNSKEIIGTIDIPGNPVYLAGININLYELAFFSGVYHIEESVHNIARDKYSTSLTVKKVNNVGTEYRKRPTANTEFKTQIVNGK